MRAPRARERCERMILQVYGISARHFDVCLTLSCFTWESCRAKRFLRLAAFRLHLWCLKMRAEPVKLTNSPWNWNGKQTLAFERVFFALIFSLAWDLIYGPIKLKSKKYNLFLAVWQQLRNHVTSTRRFKIVQIIGNENDKQIQKTFYFLVLASSTLWFV
jgi:hypothetical protein